MTGHDKNDGTEARRFESSTEAEAREDIAALCAELRRERAKQKPVTTSEILSWRHEGHAR